METTDLLKKVRQIEIKTRGLSNNIFAGQYHSAFKGRGMAFSEVREYQFGDDIRDIDWNVTARFHKPFVKVFEEERELTVMLLVDVSGSLEFGTVKQMKKDMVTEIAATLAFSAIQNNDKIGVIFFSDRIEKFIPPKKGRKHILYKAAVSFDLKWNDVLATSAAYRREPPMTRSYRRQILTGFLLPSKKVWQQNGGSLAAVAKIVAF